MIIITVVDYIGQLNLEIKHKEIIIYNIAIYGFTHACGDT